MTKISISPSSNVPWFVHRAKLVILEWFFANDLFIQFTITIILTLFLPWHWYANQAEWTDSVEHVLWPIEPQEAPEIAMNHIYHYSAQSIQLSDSSSRHKSHQNTATTPRLGGTKPQMSTWLRISPVVSRPPTDNKQTTLPIESLSVWFRSKPHKSGGYRLKIDKLDLIAFLVGDSVHSASDRQSTGVAGFSRNAVVYGLSISQHDTRPECG